MICGILFFAVSIMHDYVLFCSTIVTTAHFFGKIKQDLTKVKFLVEEQILSVISTDVNEIS